MPEDSIGLGALQNDSNLPYDINYLVLMGDSLSDRGTLNRKLLWGWLPMRLISQMDEHAPDGRFTNGMVWGDHVIANIATDFTIKRIKKKLGWDSTFISDSVISNDKRINHEIYDNYDLDDDQFVRYKGKVWVRSYCEGGLTAHNYRWKPSWNIKVFFARLILEILANKRKILFKYDQQHDISYSKKARTLVAEWSGGNDLLTVNSKPSKEIVDIAIAARIKNIRELIAKGYRHFILFNMPDLALTPRFQQKSESDRKTAAECSRYFNKQLKSECEKIDQEFPYCSINTYDINAEYTEIYHNPKKYAFDPDKKLISYIDSDDFDNPQDGLSPAKGYMFYDDIHPTADMHALLAYKFYNQLAEKFNLLEPGKPIQHKIHCREKALSQCFKQHYEKTLREQRSGLFGRHNNAHTFNCKNASLSDILDQALNKKNQLVLSVLKQLGWIDPLGQLTLEECRNCERVQSDEPQASPSMA